MSKAVKFHRTQSENVKLAVSNERPLSWSFGKSPLRLPPATYDAHLWVARKVPSPETPFHLAQPSPRVWISLPVTKN